ncbi:MAG: hypothetical protein KGL39_12550 [Patescibacteria group bacterium]|nr:hypothetical protein [Patescibacteria group bacterium]
MAVVIPFADGNAKDGVGDVTEVTGIDLTRHRSNPCVLFDHGKQHTLPVAMSEDPDTEEYTVYIDAVNRKASGRAFFYRGKGLQGISRDDEYDHAVFAEQLFHMIAKRFVRGGSFSYQIREARQLEPDYRSGTPPGLHLIHTLLLEYGPTVLPANQATVRKSYNPDPVREILCMGECCGKKLSPVFAKSLSSYVQEPTVIQSGYGSKSMPKKSEFVGDRNWAQEEQEEIEHQGNKDLQPLPHGDFSKTDVPPANWKPGAGAHCTKMKSLKAKYRAKALEFPRVEYDRRVERELRQISPQHAEVIKSDGATRNWQALIDVYRDDGLTPQQTAQELLKLDWKSLVQGEKILKHEGDKWVLYSHYGKVLGRHGSREGALAQERAIEANKHKSLPSENISPEKACQVMKDQEVRGHKLSKKQQGMFGAACGRSHGKAMSSLNETSGGALAQPAKQVGKKCCKGCGSECSCQSCQNKFHGDEDSYRSVEGSDMGMQAKSLPELRRKYRAATSLRRRTRKSRPGTSLLLIHEKDLQKCMGAAGKSGLKTQHLGTHSSGHHKVRVTGDDTAIDNLARDYGQPVHSKTLTHKGNPSMATTTRSKTLDNETPHPDDGGVHNEPAGGVPMEEPSEPYGAQVIRRLHQDRSILLEEYDEMMEHLEQPQVKRQAEKIIGQIVKEMDELEGLFGDIEEYKALPPLEGTEKKPQNVDVENQESTEEADSDEDRPNDSSAGVAEGEMGAKALRNKYIKALRRFYKGICPHCGEDPCICKNRESGTGSGDYGRGALKGEKGGLSFEGSHKPGAEACREEREAHHKVGDVKNKSRNLGVGDSGPHEPGSAALHQEETDDPIINLKKRERDDTAAGMKDFPEVQERENQTEVTEPHNPNVMPSGIKFLPHDRETLKEAHGFLGDVAGAEAFNDEHRMDAHHFHKSLEKIAHHYSKGLGGAVAGGVAGGMIGGPAGALMGAGIGSELGDAASKKAFPETDRATTYTDVQQPDSPTEVKLNTEPMQQLHPHLKAIHEASQYFGDLAKERKFGNEHRVKALYHQKALDFINQMEDEVEMNKPASPTQANIGQEPMQQFGEKGLDLTGLKSDLLKQRQDMSNIFRTVESLNGILARN